MITVTTTAIAKTSHDSRMTRMNIAKRAMASTMPSSAILTSRPRTVCACERAAVRGPDGRAAGGARMG